MDSRDVRIDNYTDICSQERVRSLSPRDFEKYCRDILLGFAEEAGLQDFQIYHDEKIKGHDGTYQIDVYGIFRISKMEFKILCECKQYKNPVKREVVTSLNQKLQSLGCQKGVVMTTSDFQSGAISFAKEHGIALIKVYDYNYDFLSHSSGSVVEDPNDPFIVAERMMPPVRASYYTTDYEKPVLIYPTHRIMDHIYETQNKLLQEQGFL